MKIILPKNLTYLILLIIICNTKIYSSSNRYISGRIVDLANEPVAGDTIWFTENTDLIEPFFAVTNSQGNYSASFFIETGVDRENATIPDQYSLVTWPNPGGPGMAINIPQNTKTQIKISIYDILGRKVRHWNYSPNQTNILLWDGRNSDGRMCSTGVYFISVEHGKKFSNYKFTFLQNNFSSPQIMQGKNSDLYKANINDVTFNIKITGPDIFQKTDEIIFPSNNDSLIFDATVNRLPYLQEWNLPDTIHVETGDNWNINLDEYFENDNPENATYFCSDPQVSISDSIATYENIQPVIKTFFFEAHELSYKVASPSITISPSNLSDTVPNVSISVDKTEGDPGLKVNFTIDIIDGNKPFKILPEFNNDFYRDAELETTERAITLSYTYDQADLYVPWFYVIDSDQDTVKVFSPKVICVNTLINPVNGVGLKLPTSTDPVGDYLKGFQIFSINQHLFESSEGELFIKNELQRLKDLGVNFLVYNPMWFADRVNSNVNYPRYHKEWAPDHFMHSLHLDELAKLINWSHDFGFKVGLRCFLHVIDLNVHTGSLRGSYNPGNRSTYLDYQKQIKALYAKFVELFNIELFSIEAENPGFSFFEDSKCVIDTIRQFYNGVLTDSPGYFEVYSSPLIPYLDLISFSHYSFYGTSLSDETNRVDTLSAKTFEKVFTNSLKYEVIPFVNHYQKPCLIMEIGGAIRDWTEEYQANLFNGILESFNKEIERDSLLMGLTIWDWDVDLLDFPPWSPRGFRAENIISDYFNNILPDYYAHRKTPLNYSAPPLWKSIEHFEVPSLPEYYYWEYEPGDWDIVWSLDSDNDFSGQKSLKLEFQNLPKKDFYTGGIGTFFNPSNWSEFERINLWLKIQENIKSDISLSIFDNDGDRFLINANSK
ncbi:MAG: T9SS type A sorting domain-containing protein, partial [Bacteroidales bacterium]|nr:T9SS type A sorting domain-containing protein [Bacteroidales bacterium]